MQIMRVRSVLSRPLVVAALAAALAACGDEVDHDMVQAASMVGPEDTVERALVPERDTWRYHDGGDDLGTAWRTGSTSPWTSGAAPLGYGESYVVTTVSYGGDPSNKHPTTYFRHGFDVPDPARVKKLYLRAMFDDGFVFYLNGSEGGRAWMPNDGPITFSTLSSGHETGNNYMTFDVSSQIPNLRAGANDLAVEVHQMSPSSSDLTMDFALIAFVEEDGTPLYEPTDGGIPEASVWKYWNAGGDIGTAWRAVDFDDTGWPEGSAPLGYGETYIATTLPQRPITTYFRHAFTSTGDASALRLRAAFDDGFVAYLNGVEVARAHMPDGPVTPTTRAFWREEDGGTADHLIPLDDFAHLVSGGMNVLAVEVHQSASTSSDLVWNASLELEGSPVVEVPQFTRDQANPVLDRTTDDPDGFDPNGPSNPTVFPMPDGSWTMLHETSNGHSDGDVIGRAVSPDGVAWTSMGQVTFGDAPFVLAAGGTFHLFSNDLDEDANHVYRHRTSTDTATWPTVQPDLGWDPGDASIAHDGSQYVLFLATSDGVLHATSPDLMMWSFTSGAVFDPHPAGIDLSILFEDGIFKMWFTRDAVGDLYHATSPDGVSWTEHGIAMPAAGAGAWDEQISGPSVQRVGDTYHLWYSGRSSASHWRIGHATMP